MLVRCSSVRGWVLLCVAGWLSACGGNAGSGPPPQSSPPDNTTLTVNTETLALAAINAGALPTPIPGTPRALTVTNTGTVVALGVAVDASLLPAGTTVASTCGTLAPLARCTLTIAPGTVATTGSVALPIQGSNTNTVTPMVAVVTYGSVYQGGYVFAIDDATPNTGSVGGKVAATSDTASARWSPNHDFLPGIDELAVASCEGAQEGACNTRVIVEYYTTVRGEDPASYLAGLCATATDDGYTDWYLPAICEAGYDGVGAASGCGTRLAPTLQNMYLNLVEVAGVGGFAGPYRTSTAVSLSHGPSGAFWMQENAPTNSEQYPTSRIGNTGVGRCVRALTH